MIFPFSSQLLLMSPATPRSQLQSCPAELWSFICVFTAVWRLRTIKAVFLVSLHIDSSCPHRNLGEAELCLQPSTVDTGDPKPTTAGAQHRGLL